MAGKVFIVGCGAIGRILIYYLSKSRYVDHIIVGDIRLDYCKRYLEWLKENNIDLLQVDAGDLNSIRKVKDVDIIVNAVVPEYNLNILKASLEINSSYIDLAFGPPYENFNEMLKYDSYFKERGLIALTGTGVAPGLSNVMASIAADDLEYVNSIRILLYGGLKAKTYISTWSPETFIQDCILPPIIVEDGELVSKRPFEYSIEYEFPKLGLKRLWIHAHEEPIMFYHSYRDKGLRYSDVLMGNLDKMKALYDLGLLRDRTVDIDGNVYKDWQIISKLLPRPPTVDELNRMLRDGVIVDSEGIILTEVKGIARGEDVKYTIWAYDPGLRNIVAKYPMATNVSYLAAINAAVLTEMIIKNEVRDKGVLTPERLSRDVRLKYLDRLKSLDVPIKIYMRVEKVL